MKTVVGLVGSWTGLLCASLLFPAPAGAAVPPGHLTGIHYDGARIVRLDLADPFQGSVTVERSLDLSIWQPLATVSLAERSVIFTDAPSPPQLAFYRLAPPLLDYRGNPTVSFEQADFTVPETNATVNLKVVRRGPLDHPLDVPWSLIPDGATPGQDYVADAGVVHFAAGTNQALIPFRVKDDTVKESDEAVKVVLSPPVGVTVTPYATNRVVIADNDSAITTVVASAGLKSASWSSDAGPPTLTFHQGRLYWNGPSDRRVLSFAAGELAPRIEAAEFGAPIHVAVAGPWLVRLEAADGISPGGCLGNAVVGKLVRSALDGSDPQILARPSLCEFVPPPVANAEAVFYVDTEVSPDSYHLMRVPINGGVAQTLLTLNHRIRSMLVAGPWLWCIEDATTDPDYLYSILWRVAIDGSSAEQWLTGLWTPAGELVRDNDFLYLADSGGSERIHRISPVERISQVLWETNDPTGLSRIRSLTLTAGQLFWLDQQCLRVTATAGGTVRTLVHGIQFPGFIAAEPVGVVWSQNDPYFNGQIRAYETDSGSITTRLQVGRHPGPLLYAGDTLIFTKGADGYYEEGSGQILALPAGSSTPIPIASGISMQQPLFAANGTSVYVMDKWTIKRLGEAGHLPVIVTNTMIGSSGFTADETSVYWATYPSDYIMAINHDGTQQHILGQGHHPISLQVKGTQLFWINDPFSLSAMSIADGKTTNLVDGAVSSFLVDGNYVFAAKQDSGQLVRLSKTGGPSTLLTSIPSFQHTVLAQTDSAVLWSAGTSIQSVPKAGGVSRSVVSGLAEAPSALATDGVKVFWLEPTADRICSAALPK